MSLKVCCFTLVVFIGVMQLVKTHPSPKDNTAVVCTLPEVRGHCRALLPRWRYDSSIGECYEFKFGGCDGNGNNFRSQKACMAVCAGV